MITIYFFKGITNYLVFVQETTGLSTWMIWNPFRNTTVVERLLTTVKSSIPSPLTLKSSVVSYYTNIF